MTEQLLSQQLESPSGTGRVEPRSQISLAAPALNERDTNTPTNPFSLASLCHLLQGSDGCDRLRSRVALGRVQQDDRRASCELVDAVLRESAEELFER